VEGDRLSAGDHEIDVAVVGGHRPSQRLSERGVEERTIALPELPQEAGQGGALGIELDWPDAQARAAVPRVDAF
jgi:hypothetical protein